MLKTSSEELTRGVVITCVDDLLLTGWQHHVDAITKALLEKYVTGSLPYDAQGEQPSSSESEGIDFNTIGSGVSLVATKTTQKPPLTLRMGVCVEAWQSVGIEGSQ